VHAGAEKTAEEVVGSLPATRVGAEPHGRGCAAAAGCATHLSTSRAVSVPGEAYHMAYSRLFLQGLTLARLNWFESQAGMGLVG
jgi:hypothetical protein